jgi:multidrug efflux pump subunit AcrB
MFCVLRWTFGAIEAIGLILFVGFSVDYTLHVAEAFHHAPMPKVENALHHVGWAVVSAAFTTTGSAFFLFFCTVQVFVKFGGAIILNSAWSLLFALVFFPALLTILPARYHEEAYEPCVAPGPVQVVGSRTEDEPERTEWGAPLPEETMETESMEESSRPSIMQVAAPCSEENLRANRDSDEESTGLPSVTDSAGGIGSAAASDAPRPPASFASL